MTGLDLALAFAGLSMTVALIFWRRHSTAELKKIRRLERESFERKQYYKTVFANAGVGIVRVDASGNIVEANESFQEFIGYDIEELKKRTVFSLVHPDDADAMQAKAIVSATGEIPGYRAERRYVRKDRKLRWADVRTSAIRDDHGSFLAFIVVVVDITERKLAELALRDGQEQLQQITENLSAAVFQLHQSLDGPRRFTYLNEEIQRITGLQRTRLLEAASEFFSQIEPEDAETMNRGMAVAARRSEKWTGDFRLHHADGSTRWLLGKALPSHQDDGTIIWNGYFSDVTERRQLDQKFRAIFDSSFDANILTDTKGRALDCNVTAVKTFKAADREEVLARGPMAFSPELQPDGQRSYVKFQGLISETLSAGHTKCEWRFCVRGEDMPAEVTLIRLDLSQPPLILVVVHNLTERKKAEAEILDSRNLLRGVIDNSMAVICAKDAHGRYLLVNRRWGEILELSEAQVIGKTDAEVFPPDQAEDYRRNDLQVLQTLKPLTIEEHATIDGERRTFLAVKFPIIDHENHANAVCGISTDITEQKNIQEDLREARRQADAANQAKSQFLANMSHEIRTPMNAIMGFAYLAQQSDPPSRTRDYLTKIQSAAKGLLGIINEILDFSKIEVGKLTLEQIEFDLEQVIDNVAGMTTLRAQEKGLELLLAIDPMAPKHLIGDPLRLEQVLVNLTNNAVKFTESGEVVVQIRPRSQGHPQTMEEGQPSSRTTLEFQIRDTGVGLTPEQIASLFQPFTQADGSTTRKYGGTGLGLSICKRLVEAMKGTIGVSSEPGKGSTFTFTAEFGISSATTANIPSPDLRKLRVLVVDDHMASREYLSHVLKSLSFEVIEAKDGREALSLLERQEPGSPIELILMDWQMPGMDGIETTRRIQTLRGMEKAPTIVMVTAFSRETAMAHAGDVPIEEFLVKPVTPSTLFEAIMRVFKKEHPERRPSETAMAALPDVSSLDGVRVLLVEDNELNQEVAVSMLSSVKMKVTTAENGRLALECLARESCDLVLMDCQMPEMDGYECSRAIRLQERFARLPIIAMTANAIAGDRERCLEAGMNDHVAKPIDPDHFFRTLVHWAPAHAERRGTTEATGHAMPPAAAPSVLPEQASIFAQVPAIDPGPALARLGGDAGQLRKLLRKFCDRHQDFGEQVGRALQQQKWGDAKRLAHTIKGVAATLGVNALPQLAAELERHLAAADAAEATTVLIAIQARIMELTLQMETLEKSDASAGKSPPVKESSPIERGRILQDLLQCLKADDSEAFSHFARLRDGTPSSKENDESLRELSKLIEAYAFDEAIPIAEALGKQLGLAPHHR